MQLLLSSLLSSPPLYGVPARAAVASLGTYMVNSTMGNHYKRHACNSRRSPLTAGIPGQVSSIILACSLYPAYSLPGGQQLVVPD